MPLIVTQIRGKFECGANAWNTYVCIRTHTHTHTYTPTRSHIHPFIHSCHNGFDIQNPKIPFGYIWWNLGRALTHNNTHNTYAQSHTHTHPIYPSIHSIWHLPNKYCSNVLLEHRKTQRITNRLIICLNWE